MLDAQLPDGVCTLPGGLVMEDGRRLARAELRQLTGYEEEWVAQHADTASALLTTKLLSDCIVRLDEMPADSNIVRQLLVGDRDFLILQLRRMTLGERFAAVLNCPACNAVMDVEFLAQDIFVEPRPQSGAIYDWQSKDSTSGRPIRFRLPNGADQEAIAELPVEEAVQNLMARCLIEDGGKPLTPDECRAVIDQMDRLTPQIDLQLELNCPECQHSFNSPFDCTAFFFSELRWQSRHLMREVHYLALYYHWSEAEILNLRCDRRRAYLALLNETLRPT